MSADDDRSTDEESLLDLALRVSDGGAVDWDETGADHPRLSATLAKLRVLETLVQEHRRGDPARESVAAEPETTAPAGAQKPRFTWGNLRALEKLGEGGFGEVWRAWDPALQREVALKLRRVENRSVRASRWLEEARRLARIRHPHVITVYGADVQDGRAGIWTDLLHGRTLEQLLEAIGPFGARDAALVGMDICTALSAVHHAGLVHGDIKTRNVMREGGASAPADAVGTTPNPGRIVLLDFGSAHESAGAATAPSEGTPLYVAPEVLEGATRTPASDLYSLGVLLYRLVTRSFPIEASQIEELREKHARHEYRPLRAARPELPVAFIQVVERALAPEPEKRFRDAGEMERALAACLGASASTVAPAVPTSKRRRRILAALIASLALVVAATVAWRFFASRELKAPFLDTPSLTLSGFAAWDGFGTVSAAGDIDQDGFDDLLIASPGSKQAGLGCGKIAWYRGGSNGLQSEPAWTASMEGSWLLGWAIAGKTNLSFDGFADIVAGAPASMYNSTHEIGRVVIWTGSSQGPAREPMQVLSTGLPGTGFGQAIATGDVNHDGADDILVGEYLFPSPEAPRGRVLLYLTENPGRTVVSNIPVWTAEGPPDSWFGIEVDLGDVNGDGYMDALIGAIHASFGTQTDQGAAYVYLGNGTALDSIPTVLPGRQAGALAGRDVLMPGDLNGDGYEEVVVGADLATNGEAQEGIVEIYFGSKGGIQPYGSVALEANVVSANFGGRLGSVGDLNGDGCAELFVGAVRYQQTAPREGAGFLYYGSKQRAFELGWWRVGGKAGSWYGTFGGAAGDLDGDGKTDLFVSAPAWDTSNGQNVGKVEIFLQTR